MLLDILIQGNQYRVFYSLHIYNHIFHNIHLCTIYQYPIFRVGSCGS